MRVSAARRNAMIDNFCTALNSGYADGYSGTRPTDADTALSGNTLLYTNTFGATAFGSASAGSATANAIGADTSADNTGTLAFERWFASNHTTAIADLSVGVGSGEVQLNTLSIVSGAQVTKTSATVSMAVGT
jgi:hypothetical protein